MFRNLFKKILSWLREIWSLFKVIDDAIPKPQYRQFSPIHSPQQYSPQITRNTPPAKQRSNVLQTRGSKDNEPSVIRHRYIELDGYDESLRVNEQGQYDLNQLAKFAENFIWVGPNDVNDFIEDGIEHDVEYIDGTCVLWVSKEDAIEWAFLQYSAIADLL